MNRRLFINQASTGLLLPFLPLSGFGEKTSDSRAIKIGFVGANTHRLVSELTKLPGVKVSSFYESGASFSEFLNRPGLDAILITATGSTGVNQAIAACQTGKSVYLAAPGTNTALAGEALVQAAQASGVILQTGYSHRSLPSFQQAAAAVQEGIIGTVTSTSAWRCTNGEPDHAYAPIELDCCRWFMGVDYPTHVKAFGNIAEGIAPALAARFAFGDKISTWQSLPTTNTTTEQKWGFTIYGDKGVLSFNSKEPSSFRVHDLSGKRIPAAWASGAITDSQAAATYHITNFIEAIRGTTLINADAESMHKSQLLLQLAAIAYRVNEPLLTDSGNGRILGNSVAMNYWDKSTRLDSERLG
ncbi:Gfo/Idh/MocA family protein [Spirosoma litoris]